MNSEPCVRFGIRISPKISEKPADSRNSTPPKVMLLTVSSSQKFISAVVPRAPCLAKSCRRRARQQHVRSGLQWRVVARIDRLRQEFRFVVGPELADVVVFLDGLVDDAVAGLFHAADVEGADDVAEMIELDRAARRVGERYRFERRHERI